MAIFKVNFSWYGKPYVSSMAKKFCFHVNVMKIKRFKGEIRIYVIF